MVRSADQIHWPTQARQSKGDETSPSLGDINAGERGGDGSELGAFVYGDAPPRAAVASDAGALDDRDAVGDRGVLEQQEEVDHLAVLVVDLVADLHQLDGVESQIEEAVVVSDRLTSDPPDDGVDPIAGGGGHLGFIVRLSHRLGP